MPVIDRIRQISSRLAAEEGFTMLIVLGVMLVTSALLVAAFTGSSEDVQLSHRDTIEKQAYYAALAGVQEYEYKLEAEPNYWQTCEEPKATVSSPTAAEADQRYEDKILVASSAPSTITKCLTSNPFESAIESKAPVANTFRIESVGCAGAIELTSCSGQRASAVATRKLIATFQVTGFLNYIYYTQYENQDPETYLEGKPGQEEREKKACSEHYRPEREKEEAKYAAEHFTVSCHNIFFASEDEVNGPMHTNDVANICAGASFGRKGHEPPDVVEIDRGVNDSDCGGGEGVFNTSSKKYETGKDLTPPESDSSLATYVEAANKFEGRTELELKGSTIAVTTLSGTTKVTKTIEWPKNGLIFVRSKGCGYQIFNQEDTDTSTTYEEEAKCGSVYVKGTYSKSLTIGAETDLIINGNITPTGISNGAAPTGTATLGLIASRFVRIYHPCSFNVNQSGSLKEPWIYAANLSTGHSFVVDNYQCGSGLGNLNVYGAIAQKYRGIVGQMSGSGYIKNYIYDERLATEEPPYYLSPLKAGWKIVRLTAP